MAVPNSRDSFKQYILRRLGAPVIEVNVDPDQLDDRIDEALQYYWDYHFDGVEKTYFKYQITQTDITNRYITLPQNIIGAIHIFPFGDSVGINNMFNIRYQIALNDLYTLTSVSMVPYYMALMNVQFMEELLVGQTQFRYNRRTNQFYIDTDWELFNVGDYIIIEAYQIVDPDTYSQAWQDLWLIKFATCLVKQQWGMNLSKFSGMELPGGVKFNGEKMFNDATAEREKLENELIYTFSLPVGVEIG